MAEDYVGLTTAQHSGHLQFMFYGWTDVLRMSLNNEAVCFNICHGLLIVLIKNSLTYHDNKCFGTLNVNTVCDQAILLKSDLFLYVHHNIFGAGTLNKI